MIEIDAVTQNQQRYLRMLKENAAFAGEQASLLSSLSFRHAQDLAPKLAVPGIADAFSEYLKDCEQRWILFLDTLCQRGDACIVREKEGFKPVLAFDYDMVVDGRK